MTTKARQRMHSACAHLLMDEYGVDKSHRMAVIDLIDEIYDSMRMAHCIIVKSIRGFTPMPQTRDLERFLEQHKTHEPKHHKGQMERRPEFAGKYEEPSYD